MKEKDDTMYLVVQNRQKLLLRLENIASTRFGTTGKALAPPVTFCASAQLELSHLHGKSR